MPNGKLDKQAPTPELLALTAVARSVAYLALHAAELTDSDLAAKVSFLERMGLNRSDCAKLLESTEESIRVALYTAKNKGKPKKKAARHG